MISSKDKKNKIKVIDKAFKLIEIVANNKEGLRLKTIANSMSCSDSSIHHLISTLVENDIITKNPINNRYCLGVRILELGNKYLSGLPFYDIASKYLEELHEEFNESIYLLNFEGTRIVLLEEFSSSKMLKSYISIKINEAHATACGKILLSEFILTQLEEHIKKNGLTKFTNNTITNKDQLLKELQNVKNQGYSFDNEELEDNLICIGAPIYNFKNKLISAIIIALPKNRLDMQKKEKIISALKNSTKIISEQLGYKANKSIV